MDTKRVWLFGMTLYLVLFCFNLDGYAGQDTNPADVSGTSPAIRSEAAPVDPSGAAKAAAQAVAVDPVFEFEPVLDGETVTHTFIIKNTGTAELKILKVRTG